ncbi:hypothetical protein [Pectobacterium aroidearum]|uniref:hypothetical protein n=1 Tax=Pectobacterium aroidearum TaxID=1201031 RepID=UPI00211555A2|nr:hypothetical protein [Pectobacterium aroidearum]UUE71100.1 hypothetical protein L0Y21_03595 [Pectobacterium aroidearum]UUE71512.1 hypothetical protein L0Y21_05835 [Pectobacterium aroidearum]UUE71580.1 hypothetical protein L0Y21_06215 [Pectobacterium aroidearum]UUE75478.1 hypothetical protein L0Y20_03600 [Pectobacterium aroidearum]UUE75499.1 hypothetical protein L0Y20_03705 [Pectobacterium aroidearum]
MTTKTSTATLAVFAPGTHTAVDGRTVTFTLDNCIDLASSYDPSLSEAPFVIGHPSLTAPAYGWAKRFEVRDGLVYAEPKQVNPAFAEAFNAGSYKKRSLSIYLPDTPNNPKPGHYYARHVGFLGAVPPAIKGLPDVQFSEASGDNAPLEFAMPFETELLADLLRGVRDYLVEKEGTERADQILPQWRIKSLEEMGTKADNSVIPQLAYAEEHTVDEKEKALAEREKALADREAALALKEKNPGTTTTTTPADELAKREADLQAREAKIAAQEKANAEAGKKQRRDDITSFADSLVTAGKILPRQKNSLVEVLVNLGNEPISFADGSASVSEKPEVLLRKLLEEKPRLLDFAEKTGSNGDEPLDFADVNAVAEQARNYQAEQLKLGRSVSTTDAVNHVKNQGK